MQINRRHLILTGMAGIAARPLLAAPDTALVAVASNFAKVAALLQPVFEAETGYRITLSSGSTGQLFAQVLTGAPYDLFLAADQWRPQRLEEAGLSLARRTYARGLLALWRPAGEASEAALRSENYAHLAIANPALAPYGRAAKEALEALGLWERLQPRIVIGQNVGQAFALVASGNAQMGLVAQSFTLGQGESWQVPEALYEPILQDAVLLRDSPAAAAFMDFLASEKAQEIIHTSGYGAL